MIRIAAVSHYLHALQDGETLPSLDEALQPLCREHFRRVDRFIQLALLGTGRCVAGKTLASDCGLYLGSGFGPMSNNIATQEQLVRDRLTPKPFNFINTLGNSAGYYVAKNLGLRGQNLFISRQGASFQAVLAAAVTDLEAGVLSEALVGVVEEVTLPVTAYRRRQGLAADAPVAEGSHWLLLQSSADAGMRLERQGVKSLNNAAAGLLPETSGPSHDSVAGADITARLMVGKECVLADGDADRGWELFHFRP
jgi:hypothetical protein